MVHTGDYRVREDPFDSALRTQRSNYVFCLHSEEIAITENYTEPICVKRARDESGESRITLAGDLGLCVVVVDRYA